jgi:hypothetical protein
MHAYCHRVSFPQGRPGGGKGGNFPRAAGLRGPQKGILESGRGPQKLPRGYFAPACQKALGGPGSAVLSRSLLMSTSFS